ncbi:hypothetical protein GCM10010520_50900 [Rhizobium viscosum]
MATKQSAVSVMIRLIAIDRKKERSKKPSHTNRIAKVDTPDEALQTTSTPIAQPAKE